MKIRLILDEIYKEPELHVCSNADTEEINEIRSSLAELFEARITGYAGDRPEMIQLSQVVRFYSANKQVFVSTEKAEYRIKERLYEIEEKLPANIFVRISNSEIVSVKKLIRLDTSITGTIKLYMKGGIETYVSRRNVSKIKKALGI